MMKDVYPDLESKASFITKVISRRAAFYGNARCRFADPAGGKQPALKTLKKNIIPGAVVFKLYDTFGFSTDFDGGHRPARRLYPGYSGV